VDEAADNGNNTLTTLLAATVGDFFGNPVPMAPRSISR
jgi:hypothetical protein